MSIKCGICDGVLQDYRGYYICPHCKAMHYVKGIHSNESVAMIKNYLNSVQKEIIKRDDEFYNLEQKYIDGSSLTESERLTRTNLINFHAIRIEIEAFLEQGASLKDDRIRGLLYRLLMLSEWLSATFEISEL